MKIRYTGDTAELDVVPAGKPRFLAHPGEWVEVDDEVGKALLEQPDWETEKAPRAKTEKE